MARRPAASCTSDTTEAVNESPGFALREVIVAVVAMENWRDASSVRVALTAGDFAGALDATSAACPDGWHAAKAATLTTVIKLFQYFGFIGFPL